ncbi:MAG: ABC transporter ATP-binding protein [Planctomycetota bacterium]|nr:MAG: ABC transporter ATP-binding protein [Planctomycetota bacterium]
MSFIKLEGVSRSYTLGEHRVTPLEKVDLEVAAGEFLVLFGPSGSGKSTLLHLLAGIDQADEGTVQVGDVELASLSRAAAADWRARSIGYVFQDYSLVPVLTAAENVELPLWLFRMSRKERQRRIDTALAAVGLSDRGHHLPRQLSGGQQQRVAIARAIVADPPLLVADEPTGNLDRKSAQEVWDLLGQLHQDFGKTIVMVTHDQAAAERGSRALMLDKGQLHEMGASL